MLAVPLPPLRVRPVGLALRLPGSWRPGTTSFYRPSRDRLEQLSRELSAEYGSRAELLQADLSREADLAKVSATLEVTEHLAVLVTTPALAPRDCFGKRR